MDTEKTSIACCIVGVLFAFSACSSSSVSEAGFLSGASRSASFGSAPDEPVVELVGVTVGSGAVGAASDALTGVDPTETSPEFDTRGVRSGGNDGDVHDASTHRPAVTAKTTYRERHAFAAQSVPPRPDQLGPR